MKDFNIITYHRSVNFGAVLQTFALQEFIRTLGFDVGIFDYRKPNVTNVNYTVRAKISGLLDTVVNNDSVRQEQKQKFEMFRTKYLNLNYSTDSRVFISGSDQVWNTGESFDSMYFLQFLDSSVYKASYAASMGKVFVADSKKELVKKYIDDFDAVSVREDGLRDYLSEAFSKEAIVHSDPTLLHDMSFYEKYTQPIEGMPEKFILAYILHIPKNINKLLKYLKKETGLDVVLLDNSGKVGLFVNNNYFVKNADPCEFLWLFKNTQCVVTSSFHGTCFSLIFEKEFYSIVNPASPGRITSLLSKFGMKPVSESDKVFERNNNIDWDHVKDILNKERKKSADYIQTVYKSACEKNKQTVPAKTGTVIEMKDSCTGCGACKSVCPVSAIKMVLNAQGFYEPVVDDNKCIKCNKCVHVCPLNENYVNEPLKAFYGWHKDSDVLFNSSSGGAFHAIADEVLKKNGAVYGAVYSNDYRDIVFKCTDEVSLISMQKSKYTVSNCSEVYDDIRKKLEAGRTVLFCGAPCQCAGLKAVFGDKYDKLITCDFVCGGFPSLLFYREHLAALEEKFSSEITGIDFRPKQWGWRRYRIFVKFANNKKYIKRDFADSYFALFNKKSSVRTSCETCHYYHFHRSDITIADFWGWRYIKGLKRYKKGMSMIICNTQKGYSLFSDINDFNRFELSLDDITYTVRPKMSRQDVLKKNKEFFDLADKYGFEKAADKVYDSNEVHYICNKILRMLHLKR